MKGRNGFLLRVLYGYDIMLFRARGEMEVRFLVGAMAISGPRTMHLTWVLMHSLDRGQVAVVPSAQRLLPSFADVTGLL